MMENAGKKFLNSYLGMFPNWNEDTDCQPDWAFPVDIDELDGLGVGAVGQDNLEWRVCEV